MSELSPLRKRLARREEARQKGAAYRNYIHDSAGGLEVGLSVVAGALLGFFFDKEFGTDPWGLLVGMFFGVAAAAKVLLEIVRKNERRHGTSAESTATEGASRQASSDDAE